MELGTSSMLVIRSLLERCSTLTLSRMAILWTISYLEFVFSDVLCLAFLWRFVLSKLIWNPGDF